MASQGELHEKLKSASGHAGQRVVQKKESESWDEDFLFQRSASDLHLPLSSSPSPNSKASRSTPKQSKAFLNGPYTNARQAASTLSFGSDSENEPTLTHATISARAKGKASVASSMSQRDATITMPRSSKQRQPIHGTRNASHSSNYSTGSSISPHDWRSPTPSLTSDIGGLTTSTETEVDTESWDDVDHYCSTTEAETEVECGPADDMNNGSFSKGGTDPSVKRKSGLRMPSIPSIFKTGKRRSIIRSSSSQQEIPQSRWSDDRDLPAELRAAKNAATSESSGQKSKRSSTISFKYNPEENVTIVPLRSKHRSRVESANGSIISNTTPPRVPRSTPSTASMDRRILDSPSSGFVESPNPAMDIYTLKSNPRAVSSNTSFLDDSAEESDGRSSFTSKKSNKRKIKRRSRLPSIAVPKIDSSTPQSSTREPSPALSPIQTAFSQTPAQPSGSSPTPRRRPLSFSMMIPTRSPSLSSRPTMQQTQSDLAPTRPPASGWKKFHRPSSSIGAIPTAQSLSNPSPPLSPPTSTNSSGFLARARAFSRSRSPPPPVPPLPSVHINQQQSFPSMPKSDSVTSTLSMQSAASTIRPSSSIPRSPFANTFDSPSHSVHSDFDSIAESAEPATPIKSKTTKQTPSPKHDLPPLNLPPLQLINKAGSHEQLSVRTPSRLAPNGLVINKTSPFPSPPGSLKRPLTATARSNANSYFTIGTASSQGASPGRDIAMAPTSGRDSPVTRRVSLSDLRIPSRITNAQARIGQDLKRVKEFKAGVEELKDLRKTYQSLISGATAHLFNTSTDSNEERTTPVPAPPAATSAKLEQAVKRIEAQYAVHWECCDVLIDLADGTDEDTPGATAARRERCISMMPTTNGSPDRSAARSQNASIATTHLSDEAIMSPQFRQMELLQGMLGHTMSRTSEVNLKAPEPQPVIHTKINKPAPQAPSRSNIFGIRDFLRALKKEAIGPGKSTLSPPSNEDRRSVSDPLRSSTSGSSAPSWSAFDSDEEEEEDWDRSSDSSGEAMATPHKLNMSRSRTMSVTTTTTSNAGAPPWPLNSKLSLTTEAMPSLLAYLLEVKERCSSCLTELRGITV